MKKINNKGFTLVELLAVVVIMLAISVIAISSITSAIERNKARQNEAKKKAIVSYAELYYEEHKNTSDASGCIQVIDLYNEGIVTEAEIKDADEEIFTGGVKYENGTNFEYVDECFFHSSFTRY